MRRINKFKAQAFLFPLLSYFRINVIGQLSFSEILAIMHSFTFVNLKKLYREIPDLKRVHIAYALFLIIQIVSDLVNFSSPANFLRGWATIVMAMVVTLFYTSTFRNSVGLIVAFLLGELLRYGIAGDNIVEVSGIATFKDMGFFKFRVVPILNAVVLLLSWYLLNKKFAYRFAVVAMFLSYAILCLAFDARSNAIFFVGIAFLLFNSSRLIGISYKKLAFAGVLIVISFQLFYSIYANQVLNGHLGNEHSRQQLLKSGSPYNPIALLVAGRGQTFAAAKAILDRPLVGHGSWAIDKYGEYTKIAYIISNSEDEFENLLSRRSQLLIPSHSVLLGAWVSAGMIGFLSILYIFMLFIKRSISILRYARIRRSPYLPIISFYMISGCWNFAFSPLSHIKYSLPIAISLIIVVKKKNDLDYAFINSVESKKNITEDIVSTP
jgi:O-antigen ligase